MRSATRTCSARSPCVASTTKNAASGPTTWSSSFADTTAPFGSTLRSQRGEPLQHEIRGGGPADVRHVLVLVHTEKHNGARARYLLPAVDVHLDRTLLDDHHLL